MTQGEPLASLLYSTALRRAIDATLILHPTITVRGIADDRIFCGLTADVLAALATYATELAKSGQTLQKSKTVIYAPAGESTIDTECVAHGYATASGLVIGGAPIGSTSYIQETLTTMIDAVAFKCTRIEQLFAVQEISNIRTHDFYRIL